MPPYKNHKEPIWPRLTRQLKPKAMITYQTFASMAQGLKLRTEDMWFFKTGPSWVPDLFHVNLFSQNPWTSFCWFLTLLCYPLCIHLSLSPHLRFYPKIKLCALVFSTVKGYNYNYIIITITIELNKLILEKCLEQCLVLENIRLS